MWIPRKNAFISLAFVFYLVFTLVQHSMSEFNTIAWSSSNWHLLLDARLIDTTETEWESETKIMRILPEACIQHSSIPRRSCTNPLHIFSRTSLVSAGPKNALTHIVLANVYKTKRNKNEIGQQVEAFESRIIRHAHTLHGTDTSSPHTLAHNWVVPLACA